MNAAAHIEETTTAQRIAADPSLSAFVSANAGSGKTRVLTNRVARLLLKGVDPSTILCITFTKAAAAEMADRLFKMLGEWALAGNAKLQRELTELDGDTRVRSSDELARARRLFARALETPGGLKIQTIHSFCESILKRFPLEAGVATGFSVIEEREASELKRASVNRVAVAKDDAIAGAFAHLLSKMTGAELRALLEESISKRRKFARAETVGWDALGDEAAEALGAVSGDIAVTFSNRFLETVERKRLEAALAAFEATGGNPQKYFTPPLRRYLAAQGGSERIEALAAIFLTSNGEPRKSFGTKATASIDPTIEPFMFETQGRFIVEIDRIRAAEALQDTQAFFSIIERSFAEYAALKASRAALDFDDLIARTRDLLRSEGGVQWVLYRLDMGLAHILLDEAQDTGPDAWDVIEPPLSEFFAGAGAREQARTFFAVGDQKQSIYSFQGADAALFNEKEQILGEKISASQAYKSIPLKASFRTTAPVLRFVDALFKRDEVVENVSAERPLQHYCTREGAAGFVELWPLVKKPERTTPNLWDAPLDAAPVENPARRLAEEVASLIADWLESNEILDSQGRPIEPGDIMILVQSRGALFSEMIRALGAMRVPVAGADKIKLMDDQGVLDLISYARTALYEGDDLSLAETLKSPFFNIEEESLYDLAAHRAQIRLWDTLRDRRVERAEWAHAFEEISAAREIALGEGAAAFFSSILEMGSHSGWRRLAGRLGLSCREPIEEFLRLAHEFEAARPRSLRLFVDAIEKSGAEISREASEAGPTVRVMTAHKAKGLEANIVFLLDAHRTAQTNQIGALLAVASADGGDLPVLALGEARNNSTLAAARERAKRLVRDEYRRLLYVAATRARDRLYICGHESGRADPHQPSPAGKSWHALAEDAFDELGDAVADMGARFEGRARRLASPQTISPKPELVKDGPCKAVRNDECLYRRAAVEARPRRLSPSGLVAYRDVDPAYSPSRSAGPFLRGRILHRLLELLPEILPANRRAAADRLLAHHAGKFSDDDLTEMREEVFRVLEDPAFADVFAPGSLAEAAIGGRPKGAEKDFLLSGQIDRLAILEDRVLVVDYKTNRPPPKRVEDAPLSYLTQMAAYRGLLQEIYPGRKIGTALLWTYDARLMPLPDEALDRAIAPLLTLA